MFLLVADKVTSKNLSLGKGALVTVVHCAGASRLNVCSKTKLPPLFVQDSEICWLVRFTLLTCNGGTIKTGTQAENSEVLLAGSVAVAVMTHPGGTETGSDTAKLVEHDDRVRLVWPRKIRPSP